MKKILFWALAIIITVTSSIFQRQTGPTKPVRDSITIAEQEIEFSLRRSFHRPTDAPVAIDVPDENIDGYFRYKRYPSHEDWDTLNLVRVGDQLIAYIPNQPAAGKVNYQIVLQTEQEKVKLTAYPITIRFRNDVPAWAMIPHILLMFAAMLFSNRAAIAAGGKEKTYLYTLLTLITFVGGGLIFGPIVQKYAFGDWWTGWPLGTDLTDNKTAFALIFWIVAFFKTRNNPNHRTWVLVAAIILLAIYFIPHSLLGSEIDWTQEQLQ